MSSIWQNMSAWFRSQPEPPRMDNEQRTPPNQDPGSSTPVRRAQLNLEPSRGSPQISDVTVTSRDSDLPNRPDEEEPQGPAESRSFIPISRHDDTPWHNHSQHYNPIEAITPGILPSISHQSCQTEPIPKLNDNDTSDDEENSYNTRPKTPNSRWYNDKRVTFSQNQTTAFPNQYENLSPEYNPANLAPEYNQTRQRDLYLPEGPHGFNQPPTIQPHPPMSSTPFGHTSMTTNPPTPTYSSSQNSHPSSSRYPTLPSPGYGYSPVDHYQRRRRDKEPGKYDGKGDLGDYLFHFSKVAKRNG